MLDKNPAFPYNTQLCAHRQVHMLSASLLPSPGPALNKGGIVGKGSGADGGGGGVWRHQKKMCKESESVWRMKLGLI